MQGMAVDSTLRDFVTHAVSLHLTPRDASVTLGPLDVGAGLSPALDFPHCGGTCLLDI